MTFIVSLAAPPFAIQVSDRLVTRGEIAFDYRSNKSLLIFARDGIFTMAYTGNAFLEGLPTDTWLAQLISLLPREKFSEPWMIHAYGPAPAAERIGRTLHRLCGEIDRVFDRAVRDGIGPLAIGVSVVGFQLNRRGHLRPVQYQLHRSAGVPRAHFRCVTPRRFQRGQWFAFTMPVGHSRHFEWTTLKDAVRASRGLPGAVAAVVEAVRIVAGKTRIVGKDCMCVVISLPDRAVRIRYEPVHTAMADWGRDYITDSSGNLRVQPRPRSVLRSRMTPVGFAPWIISPGRIQAPAELVGHHRTRIGPFTIHFDGPPGTGGLMGGARGQLRRGPPAV